MKRSDMVFYGICLLFGIFNRVHGIANLAYVLLALTVAITACVYTKKYDKA